MLSSIPLGKHAPLRVESPIFAFAEYFGAAGDYEVWIDVVRISDEGEDTMDEQIATYGPFDLNLRPNLFVQSRIYCLRYVPLHMAGLYEFQLRIAGSELISASQRLFVQE